MSTTMQNVNVPELIAAAQPSPFGRGTETAFDTNVRDSFEIPASKLCNLTEIVNNLDISSLAPSMKLTLKPYKLVIYQENGHFDSHRDSVRDEHHIGTLALILNSEYAGGELVVSHGQQNLVVTGALNWVAMFGDCLHTIRPVTFGTRVSLIFDIYKEASSVTQVNDRDYNYDDNFWPIRQINTEYWRNKGNITKEAFTLTPAVGLDIVWNKIYLALDSELEKYATVSICLEHLYPACQANLESLKGDDAKLYQMLKDK